MIETLEKKKTRKHFDHSQQFDRHQQQKNSIDEIFWRLNKQTNNSF